MQFLLLLLVLQVNAVEDPVITQDISIRSFTQLNEILPGPHR
jgi:hypothetical protein